MPIFNENQNDKSFKFYFDTTVDVRNTYGLILNGSLDTELFKTIAKNFVVPEDIVLRSNNRVEEIKSGKNVAFDKSTGNYKSLAYGYVHYDTTSVVSVFPIINIDELWRGVIILPPQNNLSKVVGIDTILSIIGDIPIKLNVNYEGLAIALKQSIEGSPVMFTFVQGRKAINGKVSKVILDYDFKIDIGRETADGKIDFKERGFVHNVDKGVQIAHYDEEVPTIDGLDIYDNVIRATYDKDEFYKLGDNVEVASDNVSIVTTAKGVLSNSNNILNVHNLVEIDKVDLSTGNINISGSVLIKENVLPGFTIQSDGDVIVYGNVTDARIFASGNLIVSAGITGGSFSKIEIKGSIYTGFLSNVTVESKGDIVVGQILNSNVTADNRVIAMNGKGAIIGGHIFAQKGVYAKVIGSSSATPSLITVGRDLESENRLKIITGILKKNREDIEQQKASLGNEYLRNPKEFLTYLPSDKKEIVRNILKKIALLVQETNEVNQERKDITSKIEKLSVHGVSVVDTIFAGVSLYIVTAKKTIDTKQAYTEFYYSNEYETILERTVTVLNENEYTNMILKTK